RGDGRGERVPRGLERGLVGPVERDDDGPQAGRLAARLPHDPLLQRRARDHGDPAARGVGVRRVGDEPRHRQPLGARAAAVAVRTPLVHRGLRARQPARRGDGVPHAHTEQVRDVRRERDPVRRVGPGARGQLQRAQPPVRRRPDERLVDGAAVVVQLRVRAPQAVGGRDTPDRADRPDVAGGQGAPAVEHDQVAVGVLRGDLVVRGAGDDAAREQRRRDERRPDEDRGPRGGQTTQAAAHPAEGQADGRADAGHGPSSGPRRRRPGPPGSRWRRGRAAGHPRGRCRRGAARRRRGVYSAASAATGRVRTAARAGSTEATSPATSATASITPTSAHGTTNGTVPTLPRAAVAPAQPYTRPSTMPSTAPTPAMSIPSTASVPRSCPVVSPMARSIAFSRVRSITESDSVLATPMSAMTTATASSPTTIPRITSMTCWYASRSTTAPLISTASSVEETASCSAATVAATSAPSATPAHRAFGATAGVTAARSSGVRKASFVRRSLGTTSSVTSPAGPLSVIVSRPS